MLTKNSFIEYLPTDSLRFQFIYSWNFLTVAVEAGDLVYIITKEIGRCYCDG
jgi:hypothetical protein